MNCKGCSRTWGLASIPRDPAHHHVPPATLSAVDAAAHRGAAVVVDVPREGPVGESGGGRATWLPPLSAADREALVAAATLVESSRRAAPAGGDDEAAAGSNWRRAARRTMTGNR